MARRRGVRPRDALRSDQEQRDGRVLKAFRRVSPDDSQLLGGTIAELAQDNSIPPVRSIPMGHQAFVFDPRLMPRGVNEHLIAGIEIGKFLAQVDKAEEIHREDEFAVGLGELSVAGRSRRTVLVDLDSERLVAERSGFYGILGKHGVAGFTSDGELKGRRVGSCTLSVATLEQPLAKALEDEVFEAIGTALAVTFAGEHDEGDLMLGKLETVAYKPR